MPVNTLLDLPVKLASDTLDLIDDQDFELDLRVVAAPSTTLPMRFGSNYGTCTTYCGSTSCNYSCAWTCDNVSCNNTCLNCNDGC